MSHVRTQIRDRVATLLAGVGTVHKSRAWNVAEAALPVILVYTNSEEIDAEDFEVLERRLQLVVEPIVQAATVDTTLDGLVADIEAAIGADVGLNGAATHCLLTGIEIFTSTEGSAPIARARMTYVAHYRTTFADPETPL